MSVYREFRDFALKGNVVDLAVWVIIGTAFGKIVTSLVEDVIMPVIAQITGGLDFSNMYYAFGNTLIRDVLPLSDAKKIGAVFAYGNFLTVTLNFLIIAWCVFLIAKAINKALRKNTHEKPVAPGPTDIELLTEIRDLLAQKEEKKVS